MLEYESDHSTSDESDVDGLYTQLTVILVSLIMRTPGVKKALTTTNEQLRRLSQEKKPVMLYDYNKYIAQHYAFMMKVILAILKPKSFG